MGIVNATPDSFSDGGKYSPLQQVKELVKQGAKIIDIGAESTRPNATVLTDEQEWDRLKDLLPEVRKQFSDLIISLDSYKPATIEKALPYIDIINDVSGMENVEMIELAREFISTPCHPRLDRGSREDPSGDSRVRGNDIIGGKKVIFMHNLGVPANKAKIVQGDVVKEVYKWGKRKVKQLKKAGIKKENMIFDIGIGFGKDAEQSWELIRNIKKFQKLGVEILVGHSRKSFLEPIAGNMAEGRDVETATISKLLEGEVDYLRVHNYSLNK